jgi:hypothetical protein
MGKIFILSIPYRTPYRVVSAKDVKWLVTTGGSAFYIPATATNTLLKITNLDNKPGILPGFPLF